MDTVPVKVKRKRVGLFGGAFDPPHVDHMNVVRAVLESGFVDEIWLIPAGTRMEKEMIASSNDRFLMCQRALADFFPEGASVAVKDFQIKDDSPSFTIDILRQCQHLYSDYDFSIIIGNDLLQDLRAWKEGEKLVKEAEFLIVERMHDGDPHNLLYPSKYVIIYCPSRIGCSSTLIRSLCFSRKDISCFVTRGVHKHIKERGLYQ